MSISVAVHNYLLTYLHAYLPTYLLTYLLTDLLTYLLTYLAAGVSGESASSAYTAVPSDNAAAASLLILPKQRPVGSHHSAPATML